MSGRDQRLHSGKLAPLQMRCRDNRVGIGQNVVVRGLASAGKRVFAVSPAAS